MRKIIIFEKNHGITRLRKGKLCHFNRSFLWSRKRISLYTMAPKIIIWNIFTKKKE